MITTLHLTEIVRHRAGQTSFHVASEKHLRVEFFVLAKGKGLGPVVVEGDTVVTCIEGTFAMGTQGVLLGPLSQAIIPVGEVMHLSCTSDTGALQVIWTPPFAAHSKDG